MRTDLGNLFALGSARAAIHLDIAQQVFLANARVHVYKCIHTYRHFSGFLSFCVLVAILTDARVHSILINHANV